MERRTFVTGLAAGAAIAALPARAAGISGALMQVGSHRLWVDDSGPRTAPPLLYIHGGPGIGALDFERYMKPALGDAFRLISVDQRGVLRSDPLPGDAKVTIDDLIADFEVIRMKLGIERWRILGHSFGGTYALRYALAHPDRVERLILESPAIDVPSSFRWLCASAAQLLNGVDFDAAVTAMRLADPATPVDTRFLGDMERAIGALGLRRQELYVVQPQNRDMFSRLAATAGLPDARWEQGQAQGRAILDEPSTYKPMLGAVAQWKGPLLLVRGAGDHVTSPAELAAVRAAGGRIVTVPDAGHFVHVEQPARLAEILKAEG
ncbi:alpha/beta hydrolase [uncultured Sphingomonas sp.]|uniref:alpha/beta hydrolase n=1 Tax=uncultured Sphingomonas sp. TaxID=158754 RepID=UPI0025FE14CB|nr:alpha/beta hydrolase [uncultured Sphingomonas sp.]